MSSSDRPDPARRSRQRRSGRRPEGAHGLEHTLRKRAAARRAVEVPAITYPPELPVSAHRTEIADAIRAHQVVIVAGATGSGKTTQIPKIALELGRGREGQIGHTQPRRIAARTVAERIAEELGGELGGVVGYQVRFTDSSSDSTLVKVMTDGILLAQIQRDPLLRAYDTLIIDEAHERSLNIDFLLGYLTQLLPKRPDLTVIITSATIDSERFATHFADADGRPAPVVEVSGRTYPVEIRYRPLAPDEEDAPSSGRGKGREDRDVMTAICEAVDELFAVGPGDVLVFLSGEREIRDADDALRGHLGERMDGRGLPTSVEVLPLFSRLSAAEQHRVFAPHGGRRVVLATNVAETSLTVPGIRYVVDPGTARISRYSKATKVQRLPIEPISQASANQRSGRCGRVAEGVAIRLYSESDFASRPEFTEPEILRTSLASVILQMISAGVTSGPEDVAEFPFIDPPDTRAIRDGVQLLTELGALGTEAERTGQGYRTRLTAVGRQLSRLPVDPRLGRMIIEGARHGVAREVIIVTAALTIQDPRERPTEQRAHADQLHARFADPTSDFLTYLNLWEYLKASRRELSSSAFRRRCKGEFVNFLRVREWQDLVGQLKDIALGMDLEVKAAGARAVVSDSGPRGTVRRAGSGARALSAVEAAAEASSRDGDTDPVNHHLAWDADTIHRALLAGLLSHLGMQQTTEVKAVQGRPSAADRRAARHARNDYLGARGARFAIFPGSAVVKKPPAWIMSAELVETSRLWARDVARVQPEWAEELGAHLVKRVYSEPHWSTKQGAALAYEKVLLYGLPIVAKRTVLFGTVDPAQARELFIRHALVQGEWTTHHAFFAANRALLEEAGELEARARRRDLVVDDDVLYEFYDQRIPDTVVSARHFDSWWKSARRTDPELLTFTPELLVPEGAAEVDAQRFPDTWEQGDLRLALTYQFTPGTAADGVTVHVPIAVLDRVQPQGFDWLVPGMLDELTVAWIRALPKSVRVQLVPAPDVAREIVGWLGEHEPSWADVTRAGDMAPSFPQVFARAVRALRDVVVPPEAFDPSRLPAHLRVTFRVSDERGVILDEGPDLLALQRRLAPQAQAAVRSAVRNAVGTAMREAQAAAAGSRNPHQGPHKGVLSADSEVSTAPSAAPPIAEQPGLATWPTDLDAIPLEVATPVGTGAGAMTVRGYPALVVELAPRAKGARNEPAVALRVLADQRRQRPEHERGVQQLLLTETALPAARVTSRWSGTQALTLAASPYPNTEALVADVQLAAVRDLTSGREAGIPAAADIRDRPTYEAARAAVRGRLEDRVHLIVGHVVAALTAARDVDAQVRATSSLALLNTLTDVRDHVARLVHDGFVGRTPPDQLAHLTRYLRGDLYRLEKAAGNPNRDAELAWRVRDVEEGWQRARAAAADGPPNQARAAELAGVRWMLEELRVSLFAQQLGTAGPVSEKRIRKVLGGW
ncbi:MAG: ATP-dependent RNA helicase HrpA [Cellulomonadaceae bacterium]